MVWTNKNTLQTLGILFIIFGILLILVALLGSTQTYQCPASGICPPYSFANVPLYGTGFILGLALIIIGIVLLLASRNMKPERDNDT